MHDLSTDNAKYTTITNIVVLLLEKHLTYIFIVLVLINDIRNCLYYDHWLQVNFLELVSVTE